MEEPHFLTPAEVLEIHQDQTARYGGRSGVRDLQVLLSALAVPQATFDGNYLHADLFEMAGAYAFHLCRNLPFLDGNKRTALASALVFLEMNGVSLNDPCGFLYDAMVKVVAGMLHKQALAQLFRRLSQAPARSNASHQMTLCPLPTRPEGPSALPIREASKPRRKTTRGPGEFPGPHPSPSPAGL